MRGNRTTIAAFVVFMAGQALRLAAMKALGSRWTIRVMTLPGEPPVRDGIYRFLRHPNYVAVVVEGIALPMVHAAWITALVFTVLNAALLVVRIRVEDAALASLPRADATTEPRTETAGA